MFDALKESEIDFAVDRWTACARLDGKARYDWRPVGLFRAPDLDTAIEKAAIAIKRPALLRATPMEVTAAAPLKELKTICDQLTAGFEQQVKQITEQLGFDFDK